MLLIQHPLPTTLLTTDEPIEEIGKEERKKKTLVSLYRREYELVYLVLITGSRDAVQGVMPPLEIGTKPSSSQVTFPNGIASG